MPPVKLSFDPNQRIPQTRAHDPEHEAKYPENKSKVSHINAKQTCHRKGAKHGDKTPRLPVAGWEPQIRPTKRSPSVLGCLVLACRYSCAHTHTDRIRRAKERERERARETERDREKKERARK